MAASPDPAQSSSEDTRYNRWCHVCGTQVQPDPDERLGRLPVRCRTEHGNQTVLERPRSVFAIQVCDGEGGCGAIIEDQYEVPQHCGRWATHHRVRNVLDSPLMRRTTVIENG